MRIGDAAKKTGLTISNIRFYEKKGLLSPKREDDSKYRTYTEEDILRLKKIILFRKMDLPLEIIAEALQDEDILTSILQSHVSSLKEKQEMLSGSIGLCEKVMSNNRIEENEIDSYLDYIKEEENKGKQFAVVEEILLNYTNMMQYEKFMGYYFDQKSMKWFGSNALLRVVWGCLSLLAPVIFLLLICIESGMPLIKILICILIMYIMWVPLLLSVYRKR